MTAVNDLVMISAHGSGFVPGTLTIEASDNGPISWHGTMAAEFHPNQALRLIILSGDKVYFGEALIKSLTIPGPDDSEPPSNEYLGAGRLGRRTLADVAEWLSRTEQDE